MSHSGEAAAGGPWEGPGRVAVPLTRSLVDTRRTEAGLLSWKGVPFLVRARYQFHNIYIYIYTYIYLYITAQGSSRLSIKPGV